MQLLLLDFSCYNINYTVLWLVCLILGRDNFIFVVGVVYVPRRFTAPRPKYLKTSLLHPLLVICLVPSQSKYITLWSDNTIMLTGIFSPIATHSLCFKNIPISSSENSYVHVSSHSYSSYCLEMFECHNVTPSCFPLVSTILLVLSYGIYVPLDNAFVKRSSCNNSLSILTHMCRQRGTWKHPETIQTNN